MIYREDKYGNKLSILGYGCMRFKQNAGKIDMARAEEQVMLAYENGVNYFDTAYIYPGSEAALGEILQKNNIRDKVYIATKLPHYMVKTRDDLDKIFNEELSRLRTDRIDYYFMHMLADVDTWNRLVELGLIEWIEEKKTSGQIEQIGFSYHGNSETFISLCDVYNWDFCMIQYNYMDENTQAGKKGLKYANSKGMPVMIMEPLRGGKLVNGLPDKAVKLISEHPSKRTAPQWSFEWLWNQPEVTVVLSGMNSNEMILENIKNASNEVHFDDGDFDFIKKIVGIINANKRIECTGCGYCMPCPKGVDIPGSFSAYNRKYSEGRFWGLKDYFMCTALRKNSSAASNCVGCGKCEKHCPQRIRIRLELENVKKELEGPLYRAAKKIAKCFFKF